MKKKISELTDTEFCILWDKTMAHVRKKYAKEIKEINARKKEAEKEGKLV